MDILEKNQDKIDWYALCGSNTSPRAFKLMADNPDEIKWPNLCDNDSPLALDLLFENQDKLDWTELSDKPYIFVHDYDAMRENRAAIKEELMEERFHPDNLPKFSGWGFSNSFESNES